MYREALRLTEIPNVLALEQVEASDCDQNRGIVDDIDVLTITTVTHFRSGFNRLVARRNISVLLDRCPEVAAFMFLTTSDILHSQMQFRVSGLD